MNLIITGNPGVGKHTTAEVFMRGDSEYQLIDINKIAMEKGFVEEYEGGFEVDTKRLKKEIQGLISENTVVVGHLAPYVFDELDIDFAIVLRKNPYQLIEIYKERTYQESKIKQNSGSEVLGVIANDAISSFGKEKTFEINTTDKTPDEVVRMINELIKTRKGGDVVDWLTLVEEKNEFDKFFDY